MFVLAFFLQFQVERAAANLAGGLAVSGRAVQPIAIDRV
jgi:hypothetical protein